jgi:outer membrane receptor protein involved in Fe transport
VVTGVRQRVRKLPDRTVYSLGQDVQATTGSAADVLNQLPSVEVGIDGNLALRGDGRVTILVDGKPSAQLSGSAAGLGLQQFPASEIDRIEVIPNPSAEFKAAGSGGVINIITRQHRQAGLSGSGQLSMGDQSRLLANGSLAYGAGPLNVTAGVVLRRDIKQRRVTTNRDAVDPLSGQTVLSSESIRETLRRLTPLFKAGLDYKLDSKTSIGASASHQELTGDRYFDQRNNSADMSGMALAGSTRHSDGYEWNKANEEEIHLTRKLARDGEEFSASLQQSVERERERYAYRNTFTLPMTGSTRDNLHLSHDLVTTEARMDYTLPLAGDRTWKFGYDFEGDRDNFDNRGDTVDPATGALLDNPNITDHFRYRQDIQALYGSFQTVVGPWTVKTGLRAEHAGIAFRSGIASPESQRSNEGFYPSLHLERALDDKQRLTLALARRINRPDPEALDPFTDYQDIHNFRAGNANLKPEDISSYEVGYAFETKPFNIGAIAYYRTSRNSFTDVTVVIGPDTVLTTKANLPRSRSGGLELTASGQLGAKLSYNLGANLFYNQIDAAALGAPGLRSATGINGKINLDYRPTKVDALQLAVSRSDRRLTPQGYVDAINLINLGYRRQVSPALAFVATVSDALNGQSFVRRTSTPLLHQFYRRRQVGQILYVGFTYSFGGGLKGKKADFEYDNK